MGTTAMRQAGYTTQEWTILHDAGPIVGLGVIEALRDEQPSRHQRFIALVRGFLPETLPTEFARNDLLLELLADFVTPLTNDDIMSDRGVTFPLIAPRSLLDHTRLVADIVETNASLAEAQVVKGWLHWLAGFVARGGSRVAVWYASETTRDLLDDLARSLRLAQRRDIPLATPPLHEPESFSPTSDDHYDG